MGKVSTLISDSLLLAWLDTGNVPAAVSIQLADEIYQELVDLKKLTTESFLHTQAFIPTTLYQNEYSLPTWFKKFEKMMLLSQKQSAPTYTAWAASTAYLAGDKCTYGWRSYICIADHTSTASFPYTTTFTTSAIMVANDTVTINGIVYTAKAAWAAANAWDFAIGIDQAASLTNLALVINSVTAGTAATFISLSDYNKSLNTDIELTATAWATTVVITSNKSITCSDTSWVGSWWSETWWQWIEIFEDYVNVVPMKVDYTDMSRFNEISESAPVYFYMQDKIRIYPKPTEAVTRGLMLDYIQYVPTLTTTTDDWALFLEDKFYKAWKYWLVYKMQEYCALDSSLFRSDYEIEKEKAHSRWANRHNNKVCEILPSLSNYSRNGR